MRRLVLLSVLAAAASGLPWPHPPMDTAHHIGNAWGSYQNYGSSPYCHNGQDIMTTALCPTLAIKAGYVKAIWLGGSPMYNGVTVADSAGAGFCSGFMYYHIDNSTIRVQVGDTIAVGDTLGLIATWSVAGFHHNHFSKNRRAGVTWPDYGSFFKNPLMELQPDNDSIAPTFLDAVSGQRFGICRNNTSTYLSKDSVYGDIDLICRLEERINHRLWKVAVYRLDFSIRDTFGNYFVPQMMALRMSDSLDGYTRQQSRVVYKQDATCPTQCNYDSLNRRYFYIFTNTDGDTFIESTDSVAGWNTLAVPDNDYWVKVIARDEYGNAVADSMRLRVRNNPPQRHDVGVIVIASPGGTADSGAVVVPACTVYNYGNFVETYGVRMRIGPGYDQAVPVAGHAVGTKLGLVFPAWTVSYPPGAYAVTCSTELPGDVLPLNDARRDTVTVLPPSALSEGGAAAVSPAQATLVAGVLYLPRSAAVGSSLLDAAGRRVMALVPGPNDVRGLNAGVYFVRAAGGGDTRKVLLQR